MFYSRCWRPRPWVRDWLAGLIHFRFLVRSLGLSILPGMNYALNAGFNWLEHSSFAPVQLAGGVLHFVFSATVLNFKQPYFRQGIFLGIIFVFILTLNLRVTRFWCRAICPLGALLGIVSRWSVFGLQKDAKSCNDCNRCLMRCQGGDDPVGTAPWRKAECVMCLNCMDSCPDHSLAFRFFPEGPKPIEAPDLQRRKAFTGIAAGVAVIPLLRSTAGLSAGRDEHLVRPPGSLRRERFSATLHSLRRVHEGLPEQCAATGHHRSRIGGSLDAGRGPAHRLLRAKLRVVLAGLPDGRDLGDHCQGKRMGGWSGSKRRKADPHWHGVL